MAQHFYLRDQAERCGRLARDGTDATLCDSLFELADQYVARAAALESAETKFETPARTTRAPI